jgi:copper(I)-binding protein
MRRFFRPQVQAPDMRSSRQPNFTPHRPARLARRFMAGLLAASVAFGANAGPGTLALSDSWARATPPGARTAAVYLTLTGGEQGDRLLGGSTPAAREVQIHTHIHAEGMMRMEQIPSLTVPAGGSASLRPGGDHIMLIGLSQPLVAGEQLELQLDFEHAGSMTVSVPIRDAR